MESLLRIGYWRNDRHPEYPDPNDWVDQNWDSEERDVTGGYLSTGTTLGAYMGSSTCRICGIRNGSLEYTDGTFAWPEGLSHYVLDHAVRLPVDIVRHAVRRHDGLEALQVSLDWWLNAER